MTKRLIAAALVAAMAAGGASAAYVQAPGMKTPWGEKVTPENAWREYPRPQMVRDAWTNLNGLWSYAVTSNAARDAAAAAFPAQWAGEILVPFAIESSLSGVGRLLQPGETLWYRRSFAADVKPGERLLLHVEQADLRTQVFVNRVEAGVPHEGGSIPFSYDVTDLVKPGANELVVSCWDPTGGPVGGTGKQSQRPSGCFYTRSSGITGTVWLETVPATHLVDYKVVTDIDAGTVSVTLDGAGNLLKARGRVTAKRGGQALATGEMSAWGEPVVLALPQPVALWSPETPALYDLEISFEDAAAGTRDVVRGYFGMRKFEMKRDAAGVLRFALNNEFRFPIATLDQGWWPDGLLTPPSDEAMAFDILTLKKMGFDAMRKHIKVEPRRYYWLCDTLGILVEQDMPSGGGDIDLRYGFYRRELKEMVDLLQKTPSVVMWIPYNERWGQPGPFLTHATLMWTQRYDPTRLVDGPSGWNDFEGGEWLTRDEKNQRNVHHFSPHPPADAEEAAHVIDKHDYAVRPKMHAVNPRRASFLGEFGGIGCRVEGHLWTSNAWGYGNTGKDTDRSGVQQKFVTLMEHVARLASLGLAGSVYTQTTDVEGEINGLVTYDRRVVKFDVDAVAAVHERVRAAAARGQRPTATVELFPRQDADAKAWAYAFEEPAAGWEKPGFDDAAWPRSAGGFGTPGIDAKRPVAKVATPWTTKALWLRRAFTCGERPAKLVDLRLDMFHDEGVEVYLNGRKILAADGYTTDYVPYFADLEASKAALKEGENVLAVKVVQTVGDQYFDTSLSLVSEK